jgi:hypothetical protein
LERFWRGTVTTEDTERHRGSQRKAEKKEEQPGGNLSVARRKQRLVVHEENGEEWMFWLDSPSLPFSVFLCAFSVSSVVRFSSAEPLRCDVLI